MIRIGEFSKLTMLTIKALRFYESEGLLLPAQVDDITGYRSYEYSQLEIATRIRFLRELGFSIKEIKAHLDGISLKNLLNKKRTEIANEQLVLEQRLSIINHLLKNTNMNYKIVSKTVEEGIFYYEERVIPNYNAITNLVLESAKECLRLNPKLECAIPDNCFVEYLDCEYKEKDILCRYYQEVKTKGKENERIKFVIIPQTKVLSVLHKGSYSTISSAYQFLLSYCKENNIKVKGALREKYIDGAWNKTKEEDYLTELQAPIE